MNEQPAPSSEWILSTTDDAFERDVVERSREVPVLVDFWAEWCQPCRMLTPLLEELVTRREGEFVLVKANTEECPRMAGEFQVSSIPTVFGFSDGQPVDFFQGLLPAEQLDSWVVRLIRRGRLVTARNLESSQPQEAEQIYREALENSPNEVDASVGLARVLFQQGRIDDTKALLETLEKRGFLEPEAEKLKARLELNAMATDDLDALRANASAAPDDLAAQLKLAEALAAAEHHEESLRRLLEIVEKDRHGMGETARQVMVDVFRVLPDDSELVRDYRRKLSMALY